MAEYSEGSSDDEYETMTTGQLLAKLEEVQHTSCMHAYNGHHCCYVILFYYN